MSIKLITKIKYKNNKIRIEWKDSYDSDANNFAFESKDSLPTSILEIFSKLKEYVNEVCELKLTESEFYKIEIIGISFSWTNSIMGATITALKELQNSYQPLVLNTPHKTKESYSQNNEDDKQLLPDDVVIKLEQLLEEINHYLVIENNQIFLFDESKLQINQ